MANINRAQEEIDNLLVLANIPKSDLITKMQIVYFSDKLFTKKEYKILQLTSNVEKCLKQGDTLHINGEPNDNAIICTENESFEILSTQTSNSLLLVDNLKNKDDLVQTHEDEICKVSIEGVFNECLEVVQIKPSLNKLHSILAKSIYKGPEHEYSIDKKCLYTFDELWKKLQTSKTELDVALKKIEAIVVDGKYRLLDFEYHFRVLSYLLKIIEENSWPLDEVNYDITIKSLTELVPIDISKTIFELYSEETKVHNGTQLYRYKEYEVCRFFAQVLLYNAGKFNFKEFLQAWQESVPEGMVTNRDMLNGIAIIDSYRRYTYIRSFPEKELPQNITERFQVLFKAKKTWSVKEISPYIQNLATNVEDVTALLTKYARPSKIDGITYYSAKHAK